MIHRGGPAESLLDGCGGVRTIRESWVANLAGVETWIAVMTAAGYS